METINERSIEAEGNNSDDSGSDEDVEIRMHNLRSKFETLQPT